MDGSIQYKSDGQRNLFIRQSWIRRLEPQASQKLGMPTDHAIFMTATHVSQFVHTSSLQ